MDEPVPLQLASMNRMEVVAIHMIHLYRDPPGSREAQESELTRFQRVSPWLSVCMTVSCHPLTLINEDSLVHGTADRACLLR